MKKNNFSPKSPTFPEKSVFCPPKFLMTFESSAMIFQIFTLFSSKATESHYKFLTFRQKPLEKMHFLVKCETPKKSPRTFKKLRKKASLREKTHIPRSDQKPQDLGRKPKEWIRWQ